MVGPAEPPPVVGQAQPEPWSPTQATELRGPFRRQRATRAPRDSAGPRIGVTPYEQRRQGQPRGSRQAPRG
eukprot:3756774-Lingulodinium_polyedra.AAC.1